MAIGLLILCVVFLTRELNFREVIFMRRHRMSKGASRRSFTKGAVNVHPKNNIMNPERGGWRL